MSALFYGSFMALVNQSVSQGVSSGIIFGVLMAGFYVYKARKRADGSEPETLIAANQAIRKNGPTGNVDVAQQVVRQANEFAKGTTNNLSFAVAVFGFFAVLSVIVALTQSLWFLVFVPLWVGALIWAPGNIKRTRNKMATARTRAQSFLDV